MAQVRSLSCRPQAPPVGQAASWYNLIPNSCPQTSKAL